MPDELIIVTDDWIYRRMQHATRNTQHATRNTQQGTGNREQGTLFPKRLDDYITEENFVRVVDVSIESTLRESRRRHYVTQE